MNSTQKQFTDDKNKSFFCFTWDLFLYTAVWKEKISFKEKQTKSNSLSENFLYYLNEVFMLRLMNKKNFSLKNAEISRSKRLWQKDPMDTPRRIDVESMLMLCLCVQIKTLNELPRHFDILFKCNFDGPKLTMF